MSPLPPFGDLQGIKVNDRFVSRTAKDAAFVKGCFGSERDTQINPAPVDQPSFAPDALRPSLGAEHAAGDLIRLDRFE